MARFIIYSAALGWGAWRGGWAGFFTMFLVAGIVMLVLWPKRVEQQNSTLERVLESQEREVEQITPARRGSAVDPTRPTTEDYAALITNRRVK